MDDRALRISVLLAAHVIFLSAGALRIIRGQRRHLLRSRDAWWFQYYPPLVWVPLVVAYFFPVPVDLPMPLRLAGLVIAIASVVFAAWAMWSLGKSYESLARLVITLVYVIPFTALRTRAEDRMLAAGFGDEFRTFSGRVPALVPFTR